MEVWNLTPLILRSFGLNLSDMNHIGGQSSFLKGVTYPLDKSVNYVMPVRFDLAQFLIAHRGYCGGCECHLVFARGLLDEECTLSQHPCAMSGQSFARGRAFSPFGGNRSSDKPKGAAAPPSRVLHFQCKRLPIPLLRVKVVGILAVAPFGGAAEVLLLDATLEVQRSFTVRINLCYYAHIFDA